MLGWMLNRGAPARSSASQAPDDTLAELPDTPAPVFAARALKSALFGTPAPGTTRSEKSKKHQAKSQSATASNLSKSSDATTLGTPAKQRPQSILLTPGVGTARRKRVSFDHDVALADGKNGSKSGLPDNCPGKFPSPWVAPAQADEQEDLAAANRPRTSLTEKLENSRKFKPLTRQTDLDGNKANRSVEDSIFAPRKPAEEKASDMAEAIWEDEDDQPEASDRERDVTVDLNEPRSGSGQFWKSEYTRYHEDARAEMEKLVRYKNLAKSYAKIKDGEALELNKRLHEEQAKVAAMETQVAELTRRIAKSHMNGTSGGSGGDEDQAEILRDLTTQATLATQYRSQVKELEAIIRNLQTAAVASPDLDTPRRRAGTRVVSPRTNQALVESQRQLKKAREQIRELEGLKLDLRAVERRVDDIQSAKERVEAELDESKAQAKDAAAKLAVVEDRARRKTEALERLQEDHSKLREESRKAAREAKAELKAKNDEIAMLKKALESQRPALLSVDQPASEQSEEPVAPYTPGPSNVDWTVNITQMELEQGTPLRVVGRRHKATEAPEPETPLREEPRTRRQTRAAAVVAVEPKATVDDATIDVGDFTQRLDQIKQSLENPQPTQRPQRAGRRTTTRSDAPEEVKPAATRDRRWSTALTDDEEAPREGGSPTRERRRSHSRTAQPLFTSTAITASTTENRAHRRRNSSALSERDEQHNNAAARDDGEDDLFKPRTVRHSVDVSVLGGSTARARLAARRTATPRPVSAIETPVRHTATSEFGRRLTRTTTTAAAAAAPSHHQADDEEGQPQIDLLADRFARLGGGAAAKSTARTDTAADTSMAGTVGNTTRGTTLPPDRHAAAIARLQRRREERRRILDKENIRP